MNKIQALKQGSEEKRIEQLKALTGLSLNSFEVKNLKALSATDINNMNDHINRTSYSVQGETAEQCPPTEFEIENCINRTMALLSVFQPFFEMANKDLCLNFPSLTTQLTMMLEILKDRASHLDLASKNVHIAFLLPHALGEKAYNIAKEATKLDIHEALHNNQYAFMIENAQGILRCQARDLPHDHLLQFLRQLIGSDMVSNSDNVVHHLSAPTAFTRPLDDWRTDDTAAACRCNNAQTCIYSLRRHADTSTPRHSLHPQYQTGTSNTESDPLSRNNSESDSLSAMDLDDTYDNNINNNNSNKVRKGSKPLTITSDGHFRYGETTIISPPTRGKMSLGQRLNRDLSRNSSIGNSLFDSSSSEEDSSDDETNNNSARYHGDDEMSNNSTWYYGPQN